MKTQAEKFKETLDKKSPKGNFQFFLENQITMEEYEEAKIVDESFKFVGREYRGECSIIKNEEVEINFLDGSLLSFMCEGSVYYAGEYYFLENHFFDFTNFKLTIEL